MVMRRFKPKIISRNCQFCDNKTEPDYKKVDELEKLLTERGKIITRVRTGICNKHQRKLSQAIKRARFLALLPFVIRA
ncbi:30S ribosomal protein S18 [Candidatus Gottesmanbacteria bacterium RBG_16_43_7]|uniref:Small ribosomal subunit protein bS18 n=1 Tax=Candidatus Gottesmanbacteria bacterium RBG_16_43_7 TaxID=1798373 RepID=A0A1F5ZBS2_9BACT|nr:MAG: 30S ribosomal protein S18 [Candidatus Gottesmanbacteria bacterium RBG_16_43_7]